MHTVTTSILHNTGSLSHSNQTLEREGIQIRKKKKNKTVIADMILERENPKISTKKLIE